MRGRSNFADRVFPHSCLLIFCLEFEAMRPLAVLACIVVGIGAISGTIWVGRYSPIAEKHDHKPFRWEEGTGDKQMQMRAQQQQDLLDKASQNAALQKQIEDEKAKVAALAAKRPEIAKTAPFPRATAEPKTYDFGSMGVNEENKHKFIIENHGEGPLLLAKGPTNCKCTISEISKNSIPPGGKAEIEMTWTPREVAPTFAKTATIWTNDPEASAIDFKIYGRVVQGFVVRPEHEWHAGHVTDVTDGTMIGTVTSAIDSAFKITSVDMPDPNVKVTYRPLTAKERMRDSLKAGYQFTVNVGKGIPIGNYRRDMKIHTTLEGNKTIDVELTALRSGPILYLSPIGNSRAYWNPEKSLINMGRFQREAGCKVVLPALVYGIKEKFQILGAESDASFVRVTTEPNTEIGSGDQQGLRFVFEVPPGSPPVTRIAPNAVRVKLTTNHPKLKEITFLVEFVSL
jgi:Protein of unknown function (DUF1573)